MTFEDGMWNEMEQQLKFMDGCRIGASRSRDKPDNLYTVYIFDCTKVSTFLESESYYMVTFHQALAGTQAGRPPAQGIQVVMPPSYFWQL